MSLKLSLIAASLLTIMSSAQAASVTPEHGGFLGNLGSAASARDILQGTCPAGTSPAVTSIQASVADQTPVKTPLLNVQIKNVSTGVNGAIQIDPGSNTSPGDGNTVFSPVSSVAGANGNIFRIEVFKTGTANQAENYELNYHCENGTVNHPVPALTYIQNQ